MTAATITFAVQLGSGGYEIARTVADRLKYRFYDWEVTSQAANEAGLSPEALAAAEQPRSLLERIVENLLATGAYVEDEAVDRLSSATMTTAIRTLTSRDYRRLIEQVVVRLAEQGEAVIVGHAGQVILRNRLDVLKVLIRGSAEKRAERLSADEGLSYDRALTLVADSDKERLAFFRQTYSIDLLSAALYDLAIDTDRLPLAVAADLVLTSAAQVPGVVSEGGTVGPST
jgi:cytidylate kinase